MCTIKNIIAGPCSIESKEQFFITCDKLVEEGITNIRGGVWKPRTKPGGFEGLGEQALKWIKEYKETHKNIRFCCEVANKEQVDLALDYGIDFVWIGARTSTDPFAVQQIAEALVKRNPDIEVFVKNPACPDLELWIGAVERLYAVGIKNVSVIHRGFKVYNTSIYRNEPLWNIPLQFKIHYPNVKMYLDPSHIAGDKKYIKELCNMAMNVYSYDGIIIESHYKPDIAWTDAKQQITPEELGGLLEEIILKETEDKSELLSYRDEIDIIDNNILSLLMQRLNVSVKVGKYKKKHNMKLFQKERFISLLNKLKTRGKELNLNEEYIEKIWNIIHEESIEAQIKIKEDL